MNRIEVDTITDPMQPSELEQRRQLETLLGNLPGMAYRCANDRAWTMYFVSEGSAALTGYDSEELVSGRVRWAELIHEDDRDQIWDDVQSALSANKNFEIQYRIVTKQGEQKWVWERGRGVTSDSGQFDAIEGFITDITALIRSESALARSDANFEAVVSTAVDGIITIDAQGHIESFNKAAEELFGYSANEVVGKNIRMLMPEPYRSEHDQYISSFLETGKSKIIGIGREVTAQREDGSGVPVHLSVSEIALNGNRCFAGIVRDLSEQKAAEKTLRATEQRFRAVFDQRHQLAGIVSTEGILLETNQKSLDFAGLERADVIGRHFWDTPWWSHSPELQQRLRDAIKAAVLGETVRFEATHPQPNGHMGTVDFSLRPITDGAGKVVFIVPESHDISEQRLAEEEAKRHRERLAHVERLSTLGEMSAGIAHEINQPLTAISLFAQAGKRLFEAGKHEKIEEVFDKLSEHALRAGAVIERMQTMARQRESAKELANCNSLIDNVVKLAEAEARIHDITIEVATSDGLPAVAVDAVQIQQVALNLLRNGMEAMRSVDCRDGNTITVQTQIRDDGDIEVAVVDTGCGVSETAAKKLFTPFSTTKDSGMGMGLSISRAIITAHGGQLEFHNNESGGATFSFTLPAAAQGDQDG